MKIYAGSEEMSVTRNRTKISSATLTNDSSLELLNIREKNMRELYGRARAMKRTIRRLDARDIIRLDVLYPKRIFSFFPFFLFTALRINRIDFSSFV